MCPFVCVVIVDFFFFKQNTAYEMRISDWSSDVCSSDLQHVEDIERLQRIPHPRPARARGELPGRHVLPTGVALADASDRLATHQRSEERRVGKECVSTCRSRW